MYRSEALVIVALGIIAAVTYYIGTKFFALSEKQIVFILVVLVLTFVIGGLVMNIRGELPAVDTDDTAQTADEELVC